jgi:hypothetical protein
MPLDHHQSRPSIVAVALSSHPPGHLTLSLHLTKFFRHPDGRVPRLTATRAVLLALHPATASAQAIGGRVIDAATKQPVARAGVLVRADTGRVSVETGRDGTFVLTLPRAGRYQLQFFPDAGDPYLSDSIDVAADAFVQREFPLALRPDPVYAEFQVDKPVVPAPGTMGPRYPEELKRRGVNGSVLAMYIVDTTGRVRPGSFRALHATDPAFVTTVATALGTATYIPAERDGRKVPQLVRHPFEFCMSTARNLPVDSATGRVLCSR